MSTRFAVFHFRDFSGLRSETRVHLAAAAIDGSGGSSRVAAIAAALEEISDARLERYEIVYKSGALGTGPPEPDSDARRRLLLLYGNATGKGSILLPSPRGLPIDEDFLVGGAAGGEL
jgi:hypothetical protein